MNVPMTPVKINMKAKICAGSGTIFRLGSKEITLAGSVVFVFKK